MSVKLYEQTDFDKAFVRVINYLKKEKIVKQISLSKEIKININNLSDILNGLRGVPKQKKVFASYVLVNKYNVRQEFLDTNKGAFLKKPLPVSSEEHPEYNELKRRVTELETRVRDLTKLLDTKDMLIDSLNKQLQKKANK